MPSIWTSGGCDGIRTHGLYIGEGSAFVTLTRRWKTSQVKTPRSPQAPEPGVTFPLDVT
jgi:hypothetical protein